jgi:hypothetical protein
MPAKAAPCKVGSKSKKPLVRARVMSNQLSRMNFTEGLKARVEGTESRR